MFNTNAIQGLKNESHARYLYIQKERGTIPYPTFEVPGMTYRFEIRNAHVYTQAFAYLSSNLFFYCQVSERFRLNSKRYVLQYVNY